MTQNRLDELDRGIVKWLGKDGRMSFTEIAAHLNVTEKTIRTRYKALTEQGILKVAGIVNPVSIGIKVVAIIQLAVESGSLANVRDRLLEFRRVRYVTMTSGEYQLLIQVHHKTYEELTEFLKELNELPGLMRVNSILQFEVYKSTFDYF